MGLIVLFIKMAVLILSTQHSDENYSISCDEIACSGSYIGPEFVNGDDLAHQFSNHMSKAVGDQLKALYCQQKYCKVDLANIEMRTVDMDNKGKVTFTLFIPFIKVNEACAAKTSFDHRGGWGHKPNKENVLSVFSKVEGLEIVQKQTPEGLVEYWLQWQHDPTQASCFY